MEETVTLWHTVKRKQLSDQTSTECFSKSIKREERNREGLNIGKRIDLTGKRFGKLIVISPAESKRESYGLVRARWLCRCDCGNEITVLSRLLINGNVKSCGCLKHEIKPKLNIIGKKFGRLTVLELKERNRNDKITYLCQCECGKTTVAIGTELVNGRRISCGCYKIDVAKSRNLGSTRRAIRSRWKNMLTRCENEQCGNYLNYGGRGITVCPEWHDFECFYSWALKSGFDKNLTLERKDVNGNYCPDNCCWVTIKEQANNRRNNHFEKAFGDTKTISEWSDETGIDRNLISYRLNKGLTMEEILKGEK